MAIKSDMGTLQDGLHPIYYPIWLSRTHCPELHAHRHLKGLYVFCGPTGERLTHSMVKAVVT